MLFFRAEKPALTGRVLRHYKITYPYLAFTYAIIKTKKGCYYDKNQFHKNARARKRFYTY